MIEINYSRRSVCMGDDSNAGTYIIRLEDDATLKDLLKTITSIKTERSLAFTGSGTHWIIKSNIGDLAVVTVDEKYKWQFDYLGHKPNTKIKTLKIEYIRGE